MAKKETEIKEINDGGVNPPSNPKDEKKNSNKKKYIAAGVAAALLVGTVTFGALYGTSMANNASLSNENAELKKKIEEGSGNYETIARLREQVAKLTADLKTATESITTLTAEVATKTQKVKDLEAALTIATKTITEYEVKMESMQKSIDEKEAQITALTADVASKTAEIAKLEEELAAAKATITKDEATIDSLNKQLSDVKESLAATQAKLDDTEKQKGALEKEYAAYKAEAEVKIAGLQKENAALEAQLTETKSQLDATMAKLDALQANYNLLEKEHNALNAQYQAYKASHSHTDTDYAALEAALAKTEADLAEAEAMIEKLSSMIEQLEADVKELTAEVSLLQEQLKTEQGKLIVVFENKEGEMVGTPFKIESGKSFKESSLTIPDVPTEGYQWSDDFDENTAVIKHLLIKEVAGVSEITVQSKPTKWIYIVDETFSSDGLNVVATMTDGTTKDVTKDVTLEGVSEGYKFTESDIADEKPVTVKYKNKTASFNLAVNNHLENYFYLDNNYGLWTFIVIDQKTCPKYLIVPEVFSGHEVEAIKCCYQSNVEFVDLSNTKITHISEFAFTSCNNLKRVILPETVTRIGSVEGQSTCLPQAFTGCSNLEEINIPSSVTIVDSYYDSENYESYFNFFNDYKLSLTIDSSTFANFDKDEELSSGLKKRYDLITQLKSIYVKKDIVVADNSWIRAGYELAASSDKEGYDFWEPINFLFDDFDKENKTCTVNFNSATSHRHFDVLEFPEFDDSGEYTVTKIGSNTLFDGRIIPDKVLIPSNIKEIASGGLWNNNIKEIEIKEGLTTAANNFVFQCTGLQKMNFPKSLTNFSLDKNMFTPCFFLKDITVDCEIVGLATSNDSNLFKSGAVIKVSNEIVSNLSFTDSYIYKNGTRGEVIGNYTTYTMK